MSFQNCKIVASNVDSDAYHRTDEKRGSVTFPVSKSMLSEFSPCPERWIKGYTRPETKALSNGSLVDCLLLTPDKFGSKYIECPATYTVVKMRCPRCNSITDAKTCRTCKTDREPVDEVRDWNSVATFCSEWESKHAGLDPVKVDDIAKAREAVASVLKDPDLDELLHNSEMQVMVVGEYHDPKSGLVIPVKALLDIVPDRKQDRFGKLLVDFKTTRNAHMRKWTKDCFEFGYGIQAAFHSDLYNAATGENRILFCHIVQESVAPFHVERRMLPEEFVEAGRGTYRNALSLYCHCLSTGTWPGYAAQVTIDGWQVIEPEGWMLTRDDFRNFGDDENSEEVQPETTNDRE